MKVLKKNGINEDFNFDKIKVAVNKSANRVGVKITDDNFNTLEKEITELLGDRDTTVERVHQVVEIALSRHLKDVANSYISYRTNKKHLANMMDNIATSVNKSFEEKDKSNGNLNSVLFSSRRTNVSKILLGEMYVNEFLNKEEREAFYNEIIYPHDRDNRLIGTHNCCVVRMENIIDGGFHINGYFCKEPKNITKAVSVMGDILVTAASAQYGGFSIDNIDTTLSKYCNKTQAYWENYFKKLGFDTPQSTALAVDRTKQELEDAIQGFEFEMNTRESSRGDYPFTTIVFGADTSYWGKEVAKTILNVRMKGHGDSIKQKMIFPKLVYRLRNDNVNDDVFNLAVKCNSVALYPDYIQQDTAAPMGCRSFLSDYYLPDGTNLLWGRGNIGVVTINLPKIYMEAKTKGIDFFDNLRKYVDMVRDIQYRTYDYIGKQKAGSNPLVFCEGGFYEGNLNPEDEIAPIVKKYFTASFGTTALHELTILATGRSILEDESKFANKVIDFIQDRIDFWKKQDGYAYSLYGTPGESLLPRQAEDFRRTYGVIEGVSDRTYFTNSFHMHVSEEINPFEKQDAEKGLFHKHPGGHIQYVRIDNPDNLKAIKEIIRKGVLENGLYQGINLYACTCNNCGNTWNGKHGENCPKCNSSDVTEFSRNCGYLSFSRKNGDTTMNDGKMDEITDRKSM